MSDSGRVVHVYDRIEGAVYIGRAAPRRRLKASPFANPYPISSTVSRREAIDRYIVHINTRRDLLAMLPTLRGKPLACWCRHDGERRTAETECHGDVLLMLLSQYSDEQLRVIGEALT
jgi:hypothetical protein